VTGEECTSDLSCEPVDPQDLPQEAPLSLSELPRGRGQEGCASGHWGCCAQKSGKIWALDGGKSTGLRTRLRRCQSERNLAAHQGGQGACEHPARMAAKIPGKIESSSGKVPSPSSCADVRTPMQSSVHSQAEEFPSTPMQSSHPARTGPNPPRSAPIRLRGGPDSAEAPIHMKSSQSAMDNFEGEAMGVSRGARQTPPPPGLPPRLRRFDRLPGAR